MPLTSIEKQRLFARLESKGWTWHEGTIYAPHRTIWFDGAEPWIGDAMDFLDRMTARLERMRGAQEQVSLASTPQVWQEAYDDSLALVECLKELGRQ
jgi:hypothetical protein